MQKRYPFKFLDAYRREDIDFFFGRQEEIETLYKMVFQSKMAVVYGPSGTGKTSLIQCGLANKFQTYDWLALHIPRGGNLLASLDKILCAESDEAFVYADLAERNAEQPIEALAQKIAAVYRASFKPLYLIFDQFEELYILGDKAEQEQFVAVVQALLRVEQPVKIILSIREEYLGHLYDFERAVPELLRKKLRVEPMNLDRVSTVIQSIGQQAQSNVRLAAGEEAAVAAGIFAKIRGEEKTLSIALPYLQVFLDKLYLHTTKDESRQSDATFSLAALAEMGDIGDVLRKFLDEQVDETASALECSAEDIWRALSPFVTLEGTKEPLSDAQLADKLPDAEPAFVQAVLQAFVNSRILRFSEATQRYEVAHDALAKQIHAKRSDEEIAVLEVQRLVKSQTNLKAEARSFFTEKQLLFIEPYLSKFRLADEEAEWIAGSRAHAQAQKEAAARREREELEKAKQQAEQERTLREAADQKARQARQRTRLAAGAAGLAVLGLGFAIRQNSVAQDALNDVKQSNIATRQSLTLVKQSQSQTDSLLKMSEHLREISLGQLIEALREKKQRLQGELVNAERALKVYQKAGYGPLVTETKAKIELLQSQIAQTEKDISKATAQ